MDKKKKETEEKSYQKITGEKIKNNNKARYDKLLEKIFDFDNNTICPTTLMEVASSLGITLKSLYEYYPLDSEGLNSIKDKLQESKANIKRKLKDKWILSDNATLNVALYKLCSDKEEREALSNRHELVGDKEKPLHVINQDDLTSLADSLIEELDSEDND